MKSIRNILITTSMILSLSEPTSYISVGPFKINDRRGKLFYSYAGSGYHFFNMPRGVWNINDEAFIFPQKEFKPNPFIEDCMQISTENRGTQFFVDPAGNPNKASFYPSKNIGILDPAIANHDFWPCIMACLFHEEGHSEIRSGPGYDLAFITAEHYCDCYSYNKMVNNGYNWTQVIAAFKLLLSKDNARLPMLIKKIYAANGKAALT